jgi:hypothetical protein
MSTVSGSPFLFVSLSCELKPRRREPDSVTVWLKLDPTKKPLLPSFNSRDSIIPTNACAGIASPHTKNRHVSSSSGDAGTEALPVARILLSVCCESDGTAIIVTTSPARTVRPVSCQSPVLKTEVTALGAGGGGGGGGNADVWGGASDDGGDGLFAVVPLPLPLPPPLLQPTMRSTAMIENQRGINFRQVAIAPFPP